VIPPAEFRTRAIELGWPEYVVDGFIAHARGGALLVVTADVLVLRTATGVRWCEWRWLGVISCIERGSADVENVPEFVAPAARGGLTRQLLERSLPSPATEARVG
jgi:hypothetical protein